MTDEIDRVVTHIFDKLITGLELRDMLSPDEIAAVEQLPHGVREYHKGMTLIE